MRITGGEFRGRSIRTAEGPGYRPATAKVRESLFSMLPARGVVFDGLRVLDLFAGSGALALECLSRGAAYALLVEKSPKAAALIRENLRELKLGPERARVLAKDLFGVLSGPPDAPFGLIFIDPPYGRDLLAPALAKVLEHGWLAPGGLVAAEVEQGAELPDAAAGLELLTGRDYGQTRIYLWQS